MRYISSTELPLPESIDSSLVLIGDIWFEDRIGLRINVCRMVPDDGSVGNPSGWQIKEPKHLAAFLTWEPDFHSEEECVERILNSDWGIGGYGYISDAEILNKNRLVYRE